MKAVVFAVLAFVLVATPVMGGRLDEESSTSSTQTSTGSFGNQTISPRSDVAMVCVTDDRLYGFCEPSDTPGRRLGANFYLYITPLNGSVTYQVLIDDVPQKLGTGDTENVATGPIIDSVDGKALRRAELVVKVKQGEETFTFDFGRVRFRSISDLDKDLDGETDDSFVEQELRKFSSSQFLWYRIKWGIAGGLAIAFGAMAAIAFSREAQERERSQLYGA